MSTFSPVAFLVITLAGASAVAQPIAVLERAPSGKSLRWQGPDPQFLLDGSPIPDLPPERVVAAFRHAADGWNGAMARCLAPRPSVVGLRNGLVIAADGHNVVLWRQKGYCLDPANQASGICRTLDEVGLTTLRYTDHPGAASDGEVREADIELNDDAFTYADDGDPYKIDLQSVIAHELGHVLGLAHNCLVDAQAAAVDTLGRPVPHCNDKELPADAVMDTMFPFHPAGDTSARVPKPQEVTALCALYEGTATGCQMSPHSPATQWPGWPAAAAVLLLVGMRRRRSS